MKLFRCVPLILFAAVLGSAQETPKSTVSIAWGPAVNGLRIGVAPGVDPSKPAIRVLFENVSPQEQEVQLGYSNGRGPVYSLKFTVRNSDGKVLEAAERPMFYPVEGLVQPVSVTLRAAGRRKHELVFPVNNIFIYSSRTDDTFGSLLKKGCPVRVAFEAHSGEPSLESLPHRWVGKLESGEVSTSH